MKGVKNVRCSNIVIRKRIIDRLGRDAVCYYGSRPLDGLFCDYVPSPLGGRFLMNKRRHVVKVVASLFMLVMPFVFYRGQVVRAYQALTETATAVPTVTSYPTMAVCTATPTSTSLIPTIEGLETVQFPTMVIGTPLPPICVTVSPGGEVCYTRTPYPTSTVPPSDTPTMTQTLTPTATGTVTSTGTATACGESIVCNGITGGGGTCVQLDACTLLFDLSWSDGSHPYNPAFGYLLAADGMLNSGTPIYVFYDNFDLTVSNYQDADRYIDFWRSINFGWNHTQVLNDYLIPALGTVVIDVPELEFNFTSTTTHQNGFGVGGYGARWATVSVNMNLSATSMPITVSTKPILMTPTPTPPITVTATSTQVPCIPPNGMDISSDWLTVKPPYLVSGGCFTILPDWNVDVPEIVTSYWNVIPAQIGIPGIRVCIDYLVMTMRLGEFDVIAAISLLVSFVCVIVIIREFRS